MTWSELKLGAAERLDPLGSGAPGARALRPGGSDFDLNPGWRPAAAPPASPAAVMILIVDRPGGPSVLLTRRADALSRHAGEIAFPGGRIDPGETAEAAALRETEEEVGLSPSRVTLLGRSSAYATVTGFAITPVVGLIAPPFTLTLNLAEVAEAFEVPLAVVLDGESYERCFREFDAGRRWFYAVAHDDRVIWGATAGMLRILRTRLLGAAMEDAA